jgi:hypothetical protein
MAGSEKPRKSDGDTWLAEMQRSMERTNAPLFTIGNQQFTPEQAREILPEIVGFINHHDAMDDYAQRIRNRCDPKHVHVYDIKDIGHKFEPPGGTFTIMMECRACWKDEIFYVEYWNGTDADLEDIAERSGLEDTGLLKWASRPSPRVEFIEKMVEIFGNEKFGDDLRCCSKNS